MSKPSKNTNSSALRSSSENTVALKTRIVFGTLLLTLVKFVVPLGIAFVALYLILFVSVCRSAGWDQVSAATKEEFNMLQTAKHRILFSSLLLMTLLLPFHGLSLAVWGRNVWAEIGHPFDEDHAILPLIPFLLLVEQSTREAVSFGKTSR